MSKRAASLVIVLVFGALVAGCANQKAPAEAAIASAETAFGAVQAEAVQFTCRSGEGDLDAIGVGRTP